MAVVSHTWKEAGGVNVREQREALGLSRMDLARRAGVGRETIRLIETGQTRAAHIGTVHRILKALREAEREQEEGGAA